MIFCMKGFYEISVWAGSLKQPHLVTLYMVKVWERIVYKTRLNPKPAGLCCKSNDQVLWKTYSDLLAKKHLGTLTGTNKLFMDV